MQSLSTAPKVSVIIPNYNHARYLPKRISSILNQTYQNFEVIYLDDASTDDSNKVFSQFLDDSRIRAIYNEVNTGNPFKQWNKGIREARGEYVWIAESDDFADPKFLEVLVDALDQNPTAGFAYCQSWEVDECDLVVSNYLWLTEEHDPERWRHNFVNNGVDECNQYMILRNTIPNASAVLFRKSTYTSIGGASENLKLCGDWLLYCKLALVSDIAFVSETLNFFRQSNSKGARGLAGKEGLFIEEKFKVLQCLSQHTQISKEHLLKSLHRLVYFWIEHSLLHKIPIDRQKNIYQIAKQLDYRVDFLLVAQMMVIVAKLTSRRVGVTYHVKRLAKLQQ